MAKKIKRQPRRESNLVAEKSNNETTASNRPSAFSPDYHFVIRDVRRVGMLAGSFIIVLVVLAFFLH